MVLPRLLAIMGSGETAPTMAKVHRGLIERTGGGGASAVLLDTPYGFQENADIVSARAVEYFRTSVGHDIDVASWRWASDNHLTRETALDLVRRAHYVFAGPGSPTYALQVWAGSPVPDLLGEKLATGGCVTFASAAAVTLGIVAVPVYEIYKVGMTPAWEVGLDLTATLGLRIAVIPHYDNTEGGNHDTRFCYLGERRLRLLEEQLPDDAFVLGVDEHTACIVDVAASTATVVGRGAMSVRRAHETTAFPAGSVVELGELRAAAADARRSARGRRATTEGEAEPTPPPPPPQAVGLLAEAQRLEQTFSHALAGNQVEGAVAAILELDHAIVDWSRDTFQSDEPDKARSILRGMIVRLGGLARSGARDPRGAMAPLVEAVLAARDRARADKDWAMADTLRDRLVTAGVEVHDTEEGTTWELREEHG